MKLPIGPSPVPVIFWRLTLVVTFLAVSHLATTQVDYPELEDINDKVSHILAFYVLSFLEDFSFPKQEFGIHKVGALLTYGVLIEFVQYFLPYRTCSLLDLAADGFGISLYRLSLPALRYVPLLGRRWKV